MMKNIEKTNNNLYLKQLIIIVIAFSGWHCSERKSPIETYVHTEGWADSMGVDFHGKTMAETGWNLSACQSCHGENYDEISDNGNCLTCHPGNEGPEACNTCHGIFNTDPDDTTSWAPPNDLKNNQSTDSVGVGAHQSHVNASLLTSPIFCSECHLTPVDVTDSSHVGTRPDGKAEVTFGSLATGIGSVTPEYNHETGTCSNVYCHGNFQFGSIIGNNVNMIWTNVGTGQAGCGTCHGIPPTGHFGNYDITQCYQCHGSVVDDRGNIIGKERHINGVNN